MFPLHFEYSTLYIKSKAYFTIFVKEVLHYFIYEYFKENY